jgi:hypothetical protein
MTLPESAKKKLNISETGDKEMTYRFDFIETDIADFHSDVEIKVGDYVVITSGKPSQAKLLRVTKRSFIVDEGKVILIILSGKEANEGE